MRNKRLDILRGIAVLLVVFYHGSVQNRLIAAGWAGVDLFFVLSGFLISGLLFVEYKRTGSINLKRFFIRRGLKLYPAFYVFLLLTLIAETGFHHVRPLGSYLGELFYVQNYGPSVWTHTWSLAVEEHFYIFLPLFLVALARFSSNKPDPFCAMPAAFLIVAILCAAFRLAAVLRIPTGQLNYWENVRGVYEPTHERMDSLFFGVLLGYLHHFRGQFLERLLSSTRNRIMLGIASGILLSSSLILQNASRLMLVLGFTWMYLGFGIFLLLCLQVQGVLPKAGAAVAGNVGRCFAFVGMYSYSIYLWHFAILRWEPIFVDKVFNIRQGFVSSYVSYLVASVAIGIVMSRLIEHPILRLRDRILPGMQPVAIAGDSAAEVRQTAGLALN